MYKAVGSWQKSVLEIAVHWRGYVDAGTGVTILEV